MALFVQLKDKKDADLWHVVEAFEDDAPAGASSRDIQRTFTCGCGLKATARGDRMAEADSPPWTNRHVAKGCFTTASEPQED